MDFLLDGNEIRGLEQNPDTKSRWAQMARSGKRVMQLLSEGRYVANVVDYQPQSHSETFVHSGTEGIKSGWLSFF